MCIFFITFFYVLYLRVLARSLSNEEKFINISTAFPGENPKCFFYWVFDGDKNFLFLTTYRKMGLDLIKNEESCLKVPFMPFHFQDSKQEQNKAFTYKCPQMFF